MKKSFIISLLFVITGFLFITINGCATKKSPGEPVLIPTNTPTNIPTPNLSPVNISAQVTKTCFNVYTCSPGSSNTSAVAEDGDGNIWASEMTASSYFKKYNNTGTELFSTVAPMIEGITVDKANNWVWFTDIMMSNTQDFTARDSNNFNGASKARFSISKGISDNYYRIGYDGTDLWVLRSDSLMNWHCYKYSTAGTLLTDFSVPAPDGYYYHGITYGDGYLWLSSFDDTYGYIYKMTTTGTIEAVYYLESFAFYGIDWVSPNTFWVAMGSEVCKIHF